jgi:hypothetical protein
MSGINDRCQMIWRYRVKCVRHRWFSLADTARGDQGSGNVVGLECRQTGPSLTCYQRGCHPSAFCMVARYCIQDVPNITTSSLDLSNVLSEACEREVGRWLVGMLLFALFDLYEQ